MSGDFRARRERRLAPAFLLVGALVVASGCLNGDGVDPPPFSDWGIAELILRDLTALDPAELALADAACPSASSTAVQLSCNAYVHSTCVSDGYASGFGSREGTQLQTLCATAVAAAPRRVEFAQALSVCDVNPGCAGDPICEGEIKPACSDAIHDHCRTLSNEFDSGFGPIARDGSGVDIVCARRKAVTAELATPAAIDPGAGSCDPLLGGGSLSQECAARISEYCAATSEGAGGFGPVGPPNGASELPLSCARTNEQYERNPEAPLTPAIDPDFMAQDLLRDEFGVLILDGEGKPQYGATHSRYSRLEAARNTSNDGRVYVQPDVADGEGGAAAGQLWVGLVLPEKLATPIGEEVPTGQTAVSARSDSGDLHTLDLDAIYGSPGQTPDKIVHVTLCDVESNLGVPNPRPCDAVGTTTRTASDVFDCYDMTLINVFDDDKNIWGTLLSIRVAAPKTDQALVVEVTYGTPQVSPSTVSLFEPTVTADGRLMIAHGLREPDAGILYSYIAPPGSPVTSDPDWAWKTGDACDVTKWETFRSVSAMYEDPYLDDYPVARFPIRDSEGRIIEFDANVNGAYPWIDRDGRNIAFAEAGSTLAYKLTSGSAQVLYKYPVTSATDPSLNFDSNRRIGRGVFGLWTHGKIVAFDGRLNSTDFGFEFPDNHHEIELYRDDALQPVSVEIGSTVAHLIGSPENLFSFLPNMRTVTPRDVVWPVTAATTAMGVTEEVVFDDWLAPAGFIFSQMNPSSDNATRALNDGFTFTADPQHKKLNVGDGYTSAPHLANSATAVTQEVAELARFVRSAAVMWEPPSFGKLLGGARVEPVAAGGVTGRGLWLDGVDDRLEYGVRQPRRNDGSSHFATGPWFHSVNLDPRGLVPDSRVRVLTWPDGSWIDIAVGALGAQSLEFGNDLASASVALPVGLEAVAREWSHLALFSEGNPGGDFTIRLYWNGFLLHEDAASASLFRPERGLFTLGWSAGSDIAGYGGWVDELKVVGHRPGAEEVCNHAQGTLVSVFDTTGWESELFGVATLYDSSGGAVPGPGRSELDAALGVVPGRKYACERKVTEPTGGETLCYGKLRKPGWNATAGQCLRDAINGGVIYVNAARSDERANEFCGTCHVDSAVTTSLDIESALSAGGVDMPLDPRRQPFQHAPKIFGMLPADYFEAGPHAAAAGLPTSNWPPTETPAGNPYEDGEPIDALTVPTLP